MKNIITLLATITFALSVSGQTSINDFLTPELQKRFDQIENYNAMIREQSFPSRQTPSIKLDSIISWRFDSVINSWYELDKSILTFYSNGAVKSWKGYGIEYIGESYYNASGYYVLGVRYKYEFGYWVKDHKSEYTYDASGNMVEHLSHQGVGNNWNLTYKENWTYDNSLNVISDRSYRMQSGTWMNERKTEFNYNSSNLETSKSEYYWANGGWFHAQKKERDYDANGNETLNIFYYGDASSWKPSSKGVTTFTSFDMPEMRMSYSWDTLQANWVITDSAWAVYNADNLLQSDTTFMWYNSSWRYSELQEKVYDNSNNVVLSELKTWGWNYWRNYLKDEFLFNADNKRVYSARYVWNDDDDYWMTNYKYESYYSATGDSSYGISSFGQDSLWVENTKGVNYYDINVSVDEVTPRDFFWVEPFQLLTTKYFYQRNGQWDLGDSTNFYYSYLLTGIDPITTGNVSIYPNPTNGYLNIVGDFDNDIQVDISDISGKLIRSVIKAGPSSRINIQDLSSGIYFIRIVDGDENVVKKIIKQ